MTFPRRLYDKFAEWLFAPKENAAQRLGLARIVFCVVYLWRISTYRLTEVVDLPVADWRPPYLFKWVPRPSELSLSILESLLVFALLLLMLGYRTRLVGFAVLGLGVAFNVCKLSGVGIGLSAFLLMFWVPVFLVWSRWGAAYSIDALLNRQRHGSRGKVDEDTVSFWPARGLLLVLAILFFTAGYSKLTHSWSENPRYVADLLLEKSVASYLRNGAPISPLNPFIASQPFLYVPMQFGALLFELSFPVVVVSRRARWAYFRVVPLFHAVNMFFLGIPVIEILAVYAVFVDWESVRRFLRLDLSWRWGTGWIPPAVLAVAFTSAAWNTLPVPRGCFNMFGWLDHYTIWVLVSLATFAWWAVDLRRWIRQRVTARRRSSVGTSKDLGSRPPASTGSEG